MAGKRMEPITDRHGMLPAGAASNWPRVSRGRQPFLRIGPFLRILDVAAVLALCGCTAPAKQNTILVGTNHADHRTVPHPNRAGQHELTRNEKDKLFRGFEHWLTTSPHSEPEAASPLLEAGQPVEAP
jgi:hypothetical protein